MHLENFSFLFVVLLLDLSENSQFDMREHDRQHALLCADSPRKFDAVGKEVAPTVLKTTSDTPERSVPNRQTGACVKNWCTLYY